MRPYRLAILRGYIAILGFLAPVFVAAFFDNALAALLWIAGVAFGPFFWRSSRQSLPAREFGEGT